MSTSTELKIKEFTMKNFKFDLLPPRVSVKMYANIANLIDSYDHNEDLIEILDKNILQFQSQF